MANWKGIIGTAFTIEEFDNYCHQLHWTSWRPSFIVLHNTADPSLKKLPGGFAIDTIKRLERYYRDQAPVKNGPPGWSAGPHLFIDDTRIWVFTPLTTPGVHSPSWNQISLGVEMLGDYAVESFDTGRGLNVKNNAVAAIAILCSVLGLDPNGIKLHKEDPATTHACPGANVKKFEFLQRVIDCLATLHGQEHFIGSIQ